MKIVGGKRACGKTTRLIEQSNKEWRFIVCASEEQARFEAYSYTGKKTGEERVNFDYSGEPGTLLVMAVCMVHDIINENSGDESAYNMLLGATLQTLARQEYKKEELENERD